MANNPVTLEFDEYANLLLGTRSSEILKDGMKRGLTIIISEGTPEQREGLQRVLNENGCKTLMFDECVTIRIPSVVNRK